jgi:hypothetical protein
VIERHFAVQQDRLTASVDRAGQNLRKPRK